LHKGIVSEEKPKPVLDEHTLAKLLEAAYVLQEHNREVREMEIGLDLKRDEAELKQKAEYPAAPEPEKKREPDASHGDYTSTLAQIVATQHQVQIRNLKLQETMMLVAERVTEMAGADGAAIGMVDGRKVRYAAIAGTRTPAPGTAVPSDRALCLPCIKNGQVFRCPDVNPEFLVDTEECRRRGIQSLIAVPIFHEGGVAGGLELYYSVPHGFTDQDIHTCQLMAGLITEALARDEEASWKKSLADERAMMLEALERLKPNLTALVEPAPARSKAAPVPPKVAAESTVAQDAYSCTKCGHGMAPGERFCGLCGAASGAVAKDPVSPPADAKWNEKTSSTASESNGNETTHSSFGGIESDESLEEALEQQFPDLFGKSSLGNDQRSVDTHVSEEHADPSGIPELSLHPKQELETGGKNVSVAAQQKDAGEAPEEHEPAETEHVVEEELAVATVPAAGNWSSAAAAREFLQQVSTQKQRSGLARFWETRRGDIYLAIAVILVACVIRWGIWSNHEVSATGAPAPTSTSSPHKAPPEPELSMFDRMLISLGLADAPAAPEDKGNPSTRVWVDLHTALYYCPGADSYGKTPKGKYMTQRDAQLDSYEPAYRKACN
jgi:GAF domain-containing protein